MLNLKDITLICVTSVKIEESISALKYCMNKCNFYDVKLVTDKKINSSSNIKIEPCQELKTLQSYSDYLISDLHKHIESKYALLIQDHAIISNENMWTNEYLEYDYIGAPWPMSLLNQLMPNLRNNKDLQGNNFIGNPLEIKNFDPNNYRVGNGAFSLRSKRLLNFISQYKNKYLNKPEDNIISIYEKHTLENEGIIIAPVKLASIFSIEFPTEYNPYANRSQTFGFHAR